MTPLDQFKDFLNRNKGRLPPGSIAQAIKFVDTFGDAYLQDPSELTELRTLICDAYGLTPAELHAAFERGSMPLYQVTADDFSQLIPEEGLLRKYITYTDKTESPAQYHAFSFLTVLGTLLGRQICIEQNTYQIWPNLATLLVGPSGEGRKTTAAEFAMKLGRASGTDDTLQTEGRFHLVAEKATSEAIHTALAGRDPAVGILYAPELTTFINKKDYTKNLINDLTRLWDCPDELPVRTQARQLEMLRNVAVSALFCSNEEWLIEAIPEDAFKGGFFARIIQIYSGGSGKVYPTPPPLDVFLREELVYGLTETQRCRGTALLTNDAQEYYNSRYYEIKATKPTDPRIIPFYIRLPEHMLRLSMLLSICERRPEQVHIERRHIEQANAIMLWVTKYLPKVYSLMGVGTVGEEAQRIIHEMLKNGGRISRTSLLRSLYKYVTAKQFDDKIATLIQAGIVSVVHGGGLFDDQKQQIYYKLEKRPEDL